MSSLAVTGHTALVLDAATAVFAANGFEGASMDEIAVGAGLTKPALYRRFASKEALFAAAVDRECDRLVSLLFATYAKTLDGPVDERLREGFRAFFDYAAENPEGFQVLFVVAHARNATDTRVSNMRRTVIDRVAELVKMEMARFGPPVTAAADLFATMIVGATEQAARRCFDEPDWDRDAVIDLMTAFLLAGGYGIDRSAVEVIAPRR